MKIKCPFCKNIYDPEACDNTCPACNKKLLVTVFKKKPEGKPGAAPATTIRPPTTITPKPPAPPPPPPPPLVPAPTPTPAEETEFVAPKPPAMLPVTKPVEIPKKTTTKVTQAAVTPAKAAAAEAVPLIKATKVVAAPPPAAAPVVSEPPPAPPPPPMPAPVPAPAPAPQAEKKHTHHGHAKAGLDVVISIQRSTATDWDAVIRVPVQVFKLANLIPARAREAITSEGLDIEELRKAVEHMDHVGRLLDIQTQTERVHIAIEPHV